MKKYLFPIWFWVFSSLISSAQTNFIAQIGGNDQDLSYAIETDNAGNILLCGNFSGTCDFDPGAGVFNLTAFPDATDGFVAKYSLAGNFLWASAFSGTELKRMLSLATDADNNVYVAGFFQGMVDFDPDPTGTLELTTNGSRDGYFLRLNGVDGSLDWVHAIGGPGTFDGIQDIQVSAGGHLYLAGEFSGTTDFDPGPGSANLTPQSAGGNEINSTFLAKYDLNAGYVWARNVGGNTLGMNVWTNTSGNDFLGITGYIGYLQGYPEDFDPGSGTVNPPIPQVQGTYEDVFVARYDGDGNFDWVNFYRNFGQEERGNDAVFGLDGSLYVIGNFINNFNNYPGSPLILDNYGNIGDDAFLLKFNNEGNLIWQKQMGVTNQNDSGYRVALDGNGNVVAMGVYQGGAVELNSAGPSFTRPNAGGYDGFVVSFNPAGDYLWSGSIGGSSHDNVTGLATFGSSVFFTGGFQLTADCDPTNAEANLTSFGSYDIFISRLTEPTASDNPFGAQPISAQVIVSGNTGYFDNNFGSAAATLFPCNNSVSRDIWYEFTAAVTNPSLDFSNLNCNAGTSGIEVTVLSGADLNDFIPIGNCTSPGNMGNFSVPLTSLIVGQTYYVAVDANGIEGCGWNIAVNNGAPPAPVCGIPENLYEGDLAATSVSLHWKNMGATQYQVQIKENGMAWQTSLVNDTFLIINSLNPFKDHTWRVRAKCGTTWTAYAPVRTFTTPQSGSTCSSPTNLVFSNVTSNTALVDWAPTTGATAYKLRRKAASPGSAWVTYTMIADQYQLPGLISDMTYSVQVRTKCGSTWFPWTPVYNFHTSSSLVPGEDRQDDEYRAKDTPLTVFPNPAQEEVYIRFQLENEAVDETSLEVFDISGRMIFNDSWKMNTGENLFRISVNDWQPGVYVLRVLSGDQVITRQLIVI